MRTRALASTSKGRRMSGESQQICLWKWKMRMRKAGKGLGDRRRNSFSWQADRTVTRSEINVRLQSCKVLLLSKLSDHNIITASHMRENLRHCDRQSQKLKHVTTSLLLAYPCLSVMNGVLGIDYEFVKVIAADFLGTLRHYKSRKTTSVAIVAQGTFVSTIYSLAPSSALTTSYPSLGKCITNPFSFRRQTCS